MGSRLCVQLESGAPLLLPERQWTGLCQEQTQRTTAAERGSPETRRRTENTSQLHSWPPGPGKRQQGRGTRFIRPGTHRDCPPAGQSCCLPRDCPSSSGQLHASVLTARVGTVTPGRRHGGHHRGASWLLSGPLAIARTAGREQLAGAATPGLSQEGSLHFINQVFKRYPGESEIPMHCSWEC